ncbi:MAG: helix-turn-helix domain-containing protein, partial [Methylobacteriaceae bacterium]|nr:helix-turn-helix domain-containing protein [Methylobacteriaceae bacterium]
PARLSRIFLLQGALALMAAVPGRSLTSVAAEAGYADHPHMAREFRDLADLSPSEVLRRAA